ncbi:MAG TPA: glycosyltransferase family 39 protein [Chthoniobacterales bacterium]|jgi:4-amino-4-deoxy-L-arabinose transferase-like glycosyltransferase|nr:glycosyltransferase family 39 protein [Chthoniobacterales bacterium]
MKVSDALAKLPRHWPLAVVAVIGAVLIFTNLGSDYLWEDEGDTAALASNILKFGVPTAWDGAAFLDSDHGARLNRDLVMVTHPWVQYYLTAASFLVFGQNTFAARFPFALASWMSILFVYFFLWRVTESRLTAFSAAALLVLSVQFLLYARQCRYCALNMLLVCWLFWTFLKMKSARECAFFVLAAVLLFHTHPYGIAPVAALGGLSLIYQPFKTQRRLILFAAPAIALLTLPWLALSSLSSSGSALNTTAAQSPGELVERCTQAFIECASVTPLIGSVIILLITALLVRAKKKSVLREEITNTAFENAPAFLETNQMSILVAVFATILLYALATAVTQSSDWLWLAGMRYASAVLPLSAMAAAIIIVKASRGNALIWLSLLFVFGLTKLTQLTPWVAANPGGLIRLGKYSVGAHVPAKIVARFLGTGLLIYVRDLWRENPGTVAKSCKFLRENAKPGDVLIVNYGMEPTYFYTRLPQAMGILREYPVYQRARELGLPEYVFGVDHVRWIVWRSAWETGPGYAIDDVLREIVERGGKITGVMEIEETVWENREDIHFHRFSDGSYLFPRTQTFPSSRIARVDWPNE